MTTDADTTHTNATDGKPAPIVLKISEQSQPGMFEQRAAEAAAAGAEFRVERPETFAERKFREYGERTDVPTIADGDNIAFLANLSAIARGDLRVVG